MGLRLDPSLSFLRRLRCLRQAGLSSHRPEHSGLFSQSLKGLHMDLYLLVSKASGRIPNDFGQIIFVEDLDVLVLPADFDKCEGNSQNGVDEDVGPQESDQTLAQSHSQSARLSG